MCLLQKLWTGPRSGGSRSRSRLKIEIYVLGRCVFTHACTQTNNIAKKAAITALAQLLVFSAPCVLRYSLCSHEVRWKSCSCQNSSVKLG